METSAVQEQAATNEKLKVSKILVIHLKSGFRRQPVLEYQVHKVVIEDEHSYTLELKPYVHHGTAQIIKKNDVNEIRFVEVYSNVDGRTYWHFDVYVYAEVDEAATVESFLDFWSGEIKQMAMSELKEQNQMLKDMYKGIESIS